MAYVDGPHAVAPPARASASGQRRPDAASGSVKTTCGTACVVGGGGVRAPRGGRPGSAPRRRGRRWRRPRCGLVLALVGEEGAVVDVADGVEPVAARRHRQAVVDRQPANPARGPTVSRPMSPVRAAGRWRRGSRRPPGASPAVGDGDDGAVRPAGRTRRRRPVRRSDAGLGAAPRRPARRRTAPSAASRPPSPRTSSVTREPRACQAVAISTATTPPPTTIEAAGARALALVASRLVQGAHLGEPGQRRAGRRRCRCRRRRRAGRSACGGCRRGRSPPRCASGEPAVAARAGRRRCPRPTRPGRRPSSAR